MRTIVKDGRNLNGVCLLGSEYTKGGQYKCRISAPEMEVGDEFEYGRAKLTVAEIVESRPHKTDRTVNVYDCILKDESFRVKVNYVRTLINVPLPKSSDFLTKEQMEKWVASQPEKNTPKKSMKNPELETI